MTRAELSTLVETIEESYEFFLAYAAQGAAGDDATPLGPELRSYLQKTERALGSLVEGVGGLVEAEGLEPPDRYHDMLEVVARDARSAGAAVRLVLAQPSISSQLVDNLNASVHLRALLTDLFLLDEAL